MDTQATLQAKPSTYRALLGIWAMLLLAACSGIPAGELTGPKKAFVLPDDIAPDKAVMVFFRDDDDRSIGIPSIWVNDRLVGALHPGRYVQAVWCAGDARVSILMRGQPEPVQAGVRRLSAGRVVYGHLHREDSGFVLRDLDEESALRRLSQVKRQSHIVNRGLADCGIAVVSPPEPVQQRVLSADALFRFDGAAMSDLLPSGQAALAALVRDIRESEQPVQRLRIVGHADRLGSAAYNDRLSEARANTVAAYLREQGLTLPMEVIGRGSREPVSRDCKGGRSNPALIACLQPDRRVSIAWWDVPKVSSP